MNHKKKLFALLLFSIFPLYALPWIIKSMIKNEYFGYILFSLLMGYFAFLMVPYDNFDLVRHYTSFNELSYISIDDIDYSDKLRSFFLLYMWVINQLGFPKESVPFLSVFIAYLALLLSLKNVIGFNEGGKRARKITFIAIFLLLSVISFINTSSGMRNYIAISLFLYSIVDYSLYKTKFRSIILTVISILFHVSILPIALLFLASLFVQQKPLVKYIFIFSLLLLVFQKVEYTYSIFIDLIGPILSKYGLYIEAYISGDLGTHYYEGKKLGDILMEKVLLALPFYLASLYLLLINKISFPNIQSFMYMLFSFIVVISVSRTLFLRYSYLFLLLFVMVFSFDLVTNKLTKWKKYFLSVFILSLILLNIGRLYANRSLAVTSWSRVLYIPAAVFLSKEIRDKKYIDGN